MDRRHWLMDTAALCVLAGPGRAARAQTQTQTGRELPTLVVLDFELVDDQDNPLTKAAQVIRLQRATAQLQQELAQRQLYRVIDPEASAVRQRQLREQQAYLYRCDDCAAQIGQLTGADLVMSTWVQKVSELILNLNVQVHDGRTGQVRLSKSVDLRGNEDESWRRAVRYLVRDMAQRRERQPGYGR